MKNFISQAVRRLFYELREGAKNAQLVTRY